MACATRSIPGCAYNTNPPHSYNFNPPPGRRFPPCRPRLRLARSRRAGAYFGPLLRRVRVVSPIEIEDDLEAHLSAKEFRDLLQLDLLIRGQPRHLPDAPQVWLAVEVSGIIYPHDVERAQRRAGALRRAGLRAIPTVAGEGVVEEAEEEARTGKVPLLRDGYARFWEEALENVSRFTFRASSPRTRAARASPGKRPHLPDRTRHPPRGPRRRGW